MSKVDRLMTKNCQIAEIGEFIVNPLARYARTVGRSPEICPPPWHQASLKSSEMTWFDRAYTTSYTSDPQKLWDILYHFRDTEIFGRQSQIFYIPRRGCSRQNIITVIRLEKPERLVYQVVKKVCSIKPLRYNFGV